MKLNAPSGVTQVQADDGTLIAVVGGQVDVEPHLVTALLQQGFAVAGADSITADSAIPMPDTIVTE